MRRRKGGILFLRSLGIENQPASPARVHHVQHGLLLRALVREKRRALSSRLDVRWLDFTARPIPVVEADGRVILEGATEARDRVLCRISDPDLR